VASPNDELIALFRELVQLMTLDEGSAQSFRVRAYENAMHEIKANRDDLSAMTIKELTALDGIGKSTAHKIREYFDTGTIAKLEALREKYPPDYVQLSKIPGLGPKTLARLRAELGVENVDMLRAAIESEQIRNLKGLGEKSEQKLAHAIERLGLSGKDNRTPIADAMPVAQRVVAALSALPEVEQAQYCGSLRRLRETVADVDIVVASTSPGPIMEAFVAMNAVKEVIGQGDTKSSVVTASGLQIDLRVVEPHQFGAACQYFTGSKAHNIKLRSRALQRGWLLNEYGLSDAATGSAIASDTEEAIYAALDLQYIPPTMREDLGEIERAAEGDLMAAVTEEDLRGDLHVHTTVSGDGRSPLEDVLARAAARGYEYLAITDHGEDLAINGVSRERLLQQRDELRALQERYPEMLLLHGVELNIGPDGGLDYDAEFRMGMDWCVAAVHSHFDLDVAQQTRRVIAAMEDPAVNVIGHLTGRMIGRRPGIEIDVDAVLRAAVETGTAIEINSALPRLDAAAEVLQRARDMGVTWVISTDAHHVDELTRMQWGTQHAARGWAPVERIANTWGREEFLAWAGRKRTGQSANENS
jgi:DNA polymerase (family 10)